MSYSQQLPPELLQQLYGLGPNKTLDYGGFTYMPVGVGGSGGEGNQGFTPQGYTAFTQGTALKPGAKGVEYGLNGDGYSGYQIQDGGTPDKQMLMAALLFAGGVGALGGFGGALAGADAGAIDPSLAVQGNSINALDAATGVPYGSEAAAGGLASPNTAVMGAGPGAGVDPMMYGGGDASTWGASGAGGTGGVAGGGAGAGGGGAYGNGFDPSLFNAGNTPATMGPSASLMQSLGMGGLDPSLLKTGASLLGGLLGSKPQQSTVNRTRDIPSWLKPYVTGQGGVLDSAQQTFAAQKNSPVPGALQNAGLGLLAQPVAPNGFSRFFPGH